MHSRSEYSEFLQVASDERPTSCTAFLLPCMEKTCTDGGISSTGLKFVPATPFLGAKSCLSKSGRREEELNAAKASSSWVVFGKNPTPDRTMAHERSASGTNVLAPDQSPPLSQPLLAWCLGASRPTCRRSSDPSGRGQGHRTSLQNTTRHRNGEAKACQETSERRPSKAKLTRRRHLAE